MTNQNLIGSLRLVSLTVAQKGSWKWAQPYRLSYYKAVERKDGYLYWLYCGRTGKMPLRDTVNRYYTERRQQGEPVTLAQAILQLGKTKVNRLIKNGWRFSE